MTKVTNLECEDEYEGIDIMDRASRRYGGRFRVAIYDTRSFVVAVDGTQITVSSLSAKSIDIPVGSSESNTKVVETGSPTAGLSCAPVQVNGWRSGMSPNIALGKAVTVSSSCHGSSAPNAVDGEDNGGGFSKDHCIHTCDSASKGNWIKVDLGTSRVITSLVLVGRKGKTANSAGLDIQIGDTGSRSDRMCRSNVDASIGQTRVTCDDGTIKGRYITVYGRSHTVLCELEAYDEPEFNVSYSSAKVTVQRTDVETGWDSNLKLECAYRAPEVASRQYTL